MVHLSQWQRSVKFECFEESQKSSFKITGKKRMYQCLNQNQPNKCQSLHYNSSNHYASCCAIALVYVKAIYRPAVVQFMDGKYFLNTNYIPVYFSNMSIRHQGTIVHSIKGIYFLKINFRPVYFLNISWNNSIQGTSTSKQLLYNKKNI